MALRDRRRQAIQLQTDPKARGYYVDAIKGRQMVALLGPFRDLYDARLFVREAWRIFNRDYRDDFCEVAIGTCQTIDSRTIGRFNAEVFGTERRG